MVVILELDCHTTKEEIDHYRCSTDTPYPHASFPHEAIFLALLLDNYENGLTMLKQKRDTPYSVQYNVVDGKFILSVSMVHDTWSMKEASILFVKKFFIWHFSHIHKLLKVCNKEFTLKYDKDDIDAALMHIWKDPHIMIMTKAPKKQIEGFLSNLSEKVKNTMSENKGSAKISEPFNKEYHRENYK